MSGVGMWIAGIVAALFTFVGLLFAAKGGHDPVMYLTGLLMAACGVAFIFWLIGKYSDQSDAH